MTAAKELLQADEEPVRKAMAAMIEAKNLISDNEVVYLPPFYHVYHAENGSAKRLTSLLASSVTDNIAAEPELAYSAQQSTGIVYDNVQQAAIDQALNPSGPALTPGGYTFRQGDKVMQIRNNYDKNVSNGDIGFISAVDTAERTLSVIYDGRVVEYDVSELNELTLAYAITIHKSQGSEFPVVVIPVTMKHFVMLQRNLIYTGITPSKKATQHTLNFN